MDSDMRVLFVTEDLSGNSLGRTHCLWQLANHLGWSSQVVSIRGARIWKPFSGTAFESECHLVTEASLPDFIRNFGPSLIVGVKPHPWSLGIARDMAEMFNIALVADVDDPDLEEKLSFRRPVKRVLRGIVRPRQTRSYKDMRRVVATSPRFVSNPALQRAHGGELLPHVRETPADPSPESVAKGPISVAFVGTVRPHKGVDVLRRAVARLAPEYTLTVTADAPADAHPWETWVGEGSMERGMEIVSQADIIAVPSLRNLDSAGQFPVKLLDAMFRRKAIVASSVGPIPWVVGNGAVLVRPGSVGSLVTALKQLSTRRARELVGSHALARAEGAFTVSANAAVFESVCVNAASSRPEVPVSATVTDLRREEDA